jgi:hypothetical protein
MRHATCNFGACRIAKLQHLQNATLQQQRITMRHATCDHPCACMCVRMCERGCVTGVSTCAGACACVGMCARARTSVRARACARAHVCANARACVRVCALVYVCVCVRVFARRVGPARGCQGKASTTVLAAAHRDYDHVQPERHLNQVVRLPTQARPPPLGPNREIPEAAEPTPPGNKWGPLLVARSARRRVPTSASASAHARRKPVQERARAP